MIWRLGSLTKICSGEGSGDCKNTVYSNCPTQCSFIFRTVPIYLSSLTYPTNICWVSRAGETLVRENRCICSHEAYGLLKVNVSNWIINPCKFRRVISALEVKIRSFMKGILGWVIKEVTTELESPWPKSWTVGRNRKGRVLRKNKLSLRTRRGLVCLQH